LLFFEYFPRKLKILDYLELIILQHMLDPLNGTKWRCKNFCGINSEYQAPMGISLPFDWQAFGEVLIECFSVGNNFFPIRMVFFVPVILSHLHAPGVRKLSFILQTLG
jgi:hypothetical protein